MLTKSRQQETIIYTAHHLMVSNFLQATDFACSRLVSAVAQFCFNLVTSLVASAKLINIVPGLYMDG